jgi:lipid-binding SYLF domain-containing protein
MRLFRFNYFMALVIFILAHTSIAYTDEYSDSIEVFKKSPAVQHFFENSYGYAVFANVGKGGIAVGGAYGNGKVYQNGKVTGTAKLLKATIGFQLGGQVFSEIIFFQDKRAYDEFTSGNFEFDATVSAVAITAGAGAKAGTEGVTAGVSAGPATGTQAQTNYKKGMAVFTHAKGGFMFEATLGGQKFSFEPNN